jgi:hypothetical protein
MGCGCTEDGNRQVNEIYEHLSMSGAPLAMAYVPYQQWETPSCPCAGLERGTIFDSLYKPFCGKGGKQW